MVVIFIRSRRGHKKVKCLDGVSQFNRHDLKNIRSVKPAKMIMKKSGSEKSLIINLVY